MGDRGLQGQGELGRRPGPDQGRRTHASDVYTFTDAKNIGLYSACKNQKTAWDVLKFATSEDQDGKLLETTGQMPIRTDLPTTYADYFKKHPDYKTFADQASRTVEVPNVPNSVEIWQEIRDNYSSSVIFGKTPVDDGHQQGGRQGRRARRPVVSTPVTASGPRPPAAGHRCSPRRTPLFLAVVFAYPLGLAVWISFHDYFFAAPGRAGRPALRRAGRTTRRCWGTRTYSRSFLNVAEFLVINVPLTVVLSLVLATALNSVSRARTFLRVSYYVPYVTASVALVAVWLFLFSKGGMVNQILGPLAPVAVVAGQQRRLAMPVIALFVTWKQLGLSSCSTWPRCRRLQGPLRVRRGRRGDQVPVVLERDRAGRPARRPRSSSSWRRSPARTCSPSPTC